MKLFPEVSTFIEKNKEKNADPKSSIHAFELVITLVIFLVLGRFLDTKFDTAPVLTLIFAFVGIFGSLASAYYRYKATSAKLDEGKVWTEKKERVEIPQTHLEDEGLVVPKGYGQDD